MMLFFSSTQKPRSINTLTYGSMVALWGSRWMVTANSSDFVFKDVTTSQYSGNAYRRAAIPRPSKAIAIRSNVTGVRARFMRAPAVGPA